MALRRPSGGGGGGGIGLFSVKICLKYRGIKNETFQPLAWGGGLHIVSQPFG